MGKIKHQNIKWNLVLGDILKLVSAECFTSHIFFVLTFQGLREMLNLSRRYGSDRAYAPPTEDKDVQTDGPPLSGA